VNSVMFGGWFGARGGAAALLALPPLLGEAAGVLDRHVPPWLHVTCDGSSTNCGGSAHWWGTVHQHVTPAPARQRTLSGHSVSDSGQAALMTSLRTTLALSPALLVTEKVMLYSPGFSGEMLHASSTGTTR
jgi:hypothetical protein